MEALKEPATQMDLPTIQLWWAMEIWLTKDFPCLMSGKYNDIIQKMKFCYKRTGRKCDAEEKFDKDLLYIQNSFSLSMQHHAFTIRLFYSSISAEWIVEKLACEYMFKFKINYNCKHGWMQVIEKMLFWCGNSLDFFYFHCNSLIMEWEVLIQP